MARYPAGKAINVARTMAKLGQRCVVSGFIGKSDEAWFRDYLAEQRPASHVSNNRAEPAPLIDSQLVSVSGDTRENISVVDPQNADNDSHIIEQGFSVTEDDVARLEDVLSRHASANHLIAFCGSLPEGLSAERFGELIEFCLGRGAAVAVDSSGPALEVAAKLPLWLIKPNGDELSELIGQPLSTTAEQISAAKELAQTIRWVLVSGGSEGATLVDTSGHRHAVLPVASSDIVGTVGCGDALVGGFLAGWQQTLDTNSDPSLSRDSAALRRGVTTASHAATQLERCVDQRAVESLENDVKLIVDDSPSAA